MGEMDYKEISEYIRNDLRLKTFPLAVKFIKNSDGFPDKTRRPSTALGKRVTICQAVTMARLYGWTVGLAREDLICVPAMIAFGFSGADDPKSTLGRLFCEVEFASDPDKAQAEAESMSRLENGAYQGILLAPLMKGLFEPDTVVIYGNPAQIMRMVQAVVYKEGRRIQGNFGGKVECTEYLLAPFQTGLPRIAMPGMGDRIFSMTQDDEAVLGLPGKSLVSLYEGLQKAGGAIGARYPVTFYQNFQPEFPKPYKKLAEDLGLF